ncbi:MAG TPA: c-type cytochrome [Candidatus Acidoferrales bacterium]|nr:c-type cytochrome [Candidatus Acidoferrales bacterium]
MGTPALPAVAACVELAVLLLVAAPAVSPLRAQAARNPLAGNAAAIREGASQFRLNCAMCHGLDARGGSRGPDLTRGVWTHGASDPEIFRTITQGVQGTLMPANDLTDTETWEVIAYLRSLAAATGPAVRGDPAAGEKLFFGDANCSLCHMIGGKGGRLGPDLSRVGSARSPAYLLAKIRDPGIGLAAGLMEPYKEWPLEYETVTVVTRDGQKILGVLRNEDAFALQMMDTAEQIHLYRKSDIERVAREPRSLMPAYGEELLSDRQLGDLVAYLETLRGERAEGKGK